VETPPGSSIGYTRAKVEEVVRLARSHPEVAYTYASVGTPVPGLAPGVDEALVYVRLVPKRRRAISQEAFGARLRADLSRIAGTSVSVFTSGFGGAQKQIQMQLQGDDAARLTGLAERMRAAVAAVPGAVDVGISTRGQRPEVAVEPSRGLAGTLGVTVAEVAQSLRPAFAGIEAGDWVDPVNGKTRKVRVRFAPQARATIADLRQLPLVVRTPDGRGAVVPLGQVVTLREALAPAQITHIGRERTVVVQANVQGRPLSDVVREAKRAVAAVALPPGYRLTEGGEARDTAEVFGRIFLALGIAVLLMYLVLVVQFGSFLDPLAILLSLPLSLIGVVVALLVTGDTLNIMSLIGVILLFGIVAKNAILLVDFAKWRRERAGGSIRDALVQAGRTRLRPIVMTSVAIIAGMIPVALGIGEGADFRAPLGRAVIGGVVTSTLLTLVVIPTVYEILDGWRVRIRARLSRALGRGGAAPAGAPRRTPARDAD
jgi:HAE1 family hydrophobic/amphiphilic exporter-1